MNKLPSGLFPPNTLSVPRVQSFAFCLYITSDVTIALGPGRFERSFCFVTASKIGDASMRSQNGCSPQRPIQFHGVVTVVTPLSRRSQVTSEHRRSNGQIPSRHSDRMRTQRKTCVRESHDNRSKWFRSNRHYNVSQRYHRFRFEFLPLSAKTPTAFSRATEIDVPVAILVGFHTYVVGKHPRLTKPS